jgi:hypothetical protein
MLSTEAAGVVLASPAASLEERGLLFVLKDARQDH